MLPGASPLLQKIIAVYKGYLHDQIEDATPEEIKDFEMERRCGRSWVILLKK